ncbi:hypothetical protein [Crateriforma conspicua]|nr:hypothetical protein [Crateriforma conspicua]
MILIVITGTAQGQPPDDSQKYHLITVTADEPSPAGRALLDSIRTTPRLSQIEARCKRFRWTPTDDAYLLRYAAQLPPNRLPVIALARSDGGVIFKASGTSIPLGDRLADVLVARVHGDRQSNPTANPSVSPRGDVAGSALLPWRDPDRPRILDQVIPDSVVTVEAPAGFSDVFAKSVGLPLLIAAGAFVLFVLKD